MKVKKQAANKAAKAVIISAGELENTVKMHGHHKKHQEWVYQYQNNQHLNEKHKINTDN